MTDDNGNLKMTGKSGGAFYANYGSIYRPGFGLVMDNLKNRRTINITSFGNDDRGWDRISLENKALNSNGEGLIDQYRIQTYNGKPTIYRTIQSVQTDLGNNPIYTELVAEFPEMVVDGNRERVNQFTNNPSALDPSQSLIVYR